MKLDNFTSAPNFDMAECDARNGYNPELWFPDSYDAETREIMEAEAIAICWTCRHREQCFNFAVEENIRHGIWGGFTAVERDVLRKAND